MKDKLPVAVHQAVEDVFAAELPHYFKYVMEGEEPTTPKLEFAASARDVSQLTMNIPAGTGDWFGGPGGHPELAGFLRRQLWIEPRGEGERRFQAALDDLVVVDVDGGIGLRTQGPLPVGVVTWDPRRTAA